MLDQDQKAQFDAMIGAAPLQPPPAVARIAALGNTTPQDGADANKFGPPAGITPDAALGMSQLVKKTAQQNEARGIINNSPPVRSFAGASQTNAAVSQGSLPGLDRIGQLASDFATGTGRFLNDAVVKSLYSAAIPGAALGITSLKDFTAPTEAAKEQVTQGQKEGNWWKMAMGGFGLATALPNGIFNSLIAPPSRGLANALPYVTESQLHPENYEMDEKGILYPKPGVDLAPETPVKNEALATEQYSNLFNILSLFVGGEEGAAKATGELPPRRGIPPPGTDAIGDAIHTQIADMKSKQVEALQQEVSTNPMTELSREKMIEFIDQHTDVQGQKAFVDPETVVNLREQGHELFGARTDDLSAATESGRPMEVPLGEYLAETAGKPFADELNQTTRFSENGVSIAEGKELGKAVEPPPQPDFKAELEADPAYFYHATSVERAHDIANQGLKTFPPNHGTDQEVWPDGGIEPRTYFGNSPGAVDPFRPEEGPHALLRVRKDAAEIVPEKGSPDFISRKAIAAKNVEYLGKDGKWHPVKKLGSEVSPEPPRSIAESTRAAVEKILRPLFLDQVFETNKVVDMTKPEFAQYSAGVEDMRRDLTDRMYERIYRQLKRELTPEWKDQVARQRAEAEDSITARRDVQARNELQYGKGPKGEPLERPSVKLSTPRTAYFYGQDVVDALPKAMFKDTSDLAKGAMHPDDAAELFGYHSGAEMLDDLMQLEKERIAGGYASSAAHLKGMIEDAANKAARDELGFDITPEGIQRMAEEMLAEEPLTNVLSAQMKYLADMAGLKLSINDVKANVARLFGDLPAKVAADPKQFVRAMRALGKKTETALRKQKWDAAFKAKQDQFTNHLQYGMALKFQRNYVSLDKTLKRWAKTSGVIGGMDYDISAALQGALRDFGYPSRRDPGELTRYLANSDIKDLRDVVTKAQQDGVALDFMNEVELASGLSNKKPSVYDLSKTSSDEFLRAADIFRGIRKYGGDIGSIERAGQRIALTDIATEVRTNAEDLGLKYTPQQVQDALKTFFGKVTTAASGVLGGNIRADIWLNWLDQGIGPLMRNVVGPLGNSEVYRVKLRNEWHDKVVGAVPNEYLLDAHTKINAPDWLQIETRDGPVQRFTTKSEVRKAFLYLGSESARAKLLSAWGDKADAVEKWILSQVTPQDVKFARALWDANETHFTLADEMYQRTRGYGGKKDIPRDIELPDGTVVPGGHIEVAYHKQLNDLLNMRQDENGVWQTISKSGARDIVPNENYPATALPISNYMKPRVGVSRPVALDLDLFNVVNQVEETIKDIAYREAMINSSRVLTDSRVMSDINGVLGPEYGKQVKPWLQYIAQGEVTSEAWAAPMISVIRQLRRNASFAMLADTLGSPTKHSTIGLDHLTGLGIDPKFTMGAMKDLALGTGEAGQNATYWRKYAYDNISELRILKIDEQQNLRASIRGENTGQKLFRANEALGYALFTSSKKMESYVAGLAKFRAELAKGSSPEDAEIAASKAVRDTQGASSQVFIPANFRSNNNLASALYSLMNGMFMSFHNTTTGALWTASREFGQAIKGGEGAGGHAWRAANKILSYGVLPALTTSLITNFVFGKHEPKAKSDLESARDDFFWNLIEGPLGGMAGLNMLVGWLHYDSNFGGPAGEVKKEFTRAADPKATQRVRQALMAFGTVTGTTSRGEGDFFQAIIDAQKGSRLDQSERNPLSFTQRAFFGRQAKYDKQKSFSSGFHGGFH